MNCPNCSHDFKAVNQHSKCPKCSKSLGAARAVPESHEQALHSVRQWQEGTKDAREEAFKVVQYYHGKQWTDEEVAKLKARRQPVLTFNRIFKKINSLHGEEITNRTDPKVRPRVPTPTQEADSNAIGDGLRYISDAQKTNKAFSRCYLDLLLPGYCGIMVNHKILGEIEQGENSDPEQRQDNRDVEIKNTYIRWDRLWWDPHSLDPDFNDAEYKGITTWWDLEKAVEFYGRQPHAADSFEEIIRSTQSVRSDDQASDDKPLTWWDPKRKRIRIEEKYFWVGNTAYTSTFTGAGYVVEPRPTGYLDEDGGDICPLLMQSAYVDEEGNRYGPAHNMLSPQDEINKRRSKALHALNTRQLHYETDALAQPETIKNKMAQPDAAIEYTRGSLSGGRVKVEMAQDVAQGNMLLLGDAKQEIDQVGPDSSSLAAQGQSGVQLQVQQQLSSLEIAGLRDNLKDLKHTTHHHNYLGIRQFWGFQKWLRITDDKETAGYRHVQLNRMMTKAERVKEMVEESAPIQTALQHVEVPPEQVQQMLGPMAQQLQAQGLPPEQLEQVMLGQIMQLPFLQEPFVANDVSRIVVDVVIDEVRDSAVLQQEELRELREIGQSMLAAGQPFPLELVIEASGLRDKDKLLKLIKPDADPQAAQLQAQMQAMQQQMVQLQLAQAQADLQKTGVQTQEIGASAQLKSAQAAGAAKEADVAVLKVESEAMHDQAIARKDNALADKHSAEARKHHVDADFRENEPFFGG